MYHNRLLCIIMRIFVKTKRDKMRGYLELKEEANTNFMMAKTDGDLRFHLLVLLALETGARVSDLIGIKTDDFSQENNKWIITYKNKKASRERKVDAKTGKVTPKKTITQSQHVTNKTMEKVNIVTNGISTYGVFYNEKKGSTMSRITANRKCTAIYGFNFHNLRKIAGKNVATQKGVVYASKFLGHSRVSTTDIYLSVSTDQFKKDMEDCII